MLIHLLAFLLAQSMFSGSLPIDGISCDATEGAVEHIHTRLSLVDARGRSLPVPAEIGIPEGAGCLYWLHTHAPNGVIHIESPVRRTFRLGQFFDIWGTTLSRRQAGPLHASVGKSLQVSVNGKPWRSDPRTIPLRDHETIVIRA
jgi:hypothetical protein